jgi:hypothetical protein
MKKLIYLFFTAGILFLCSCKKTSTVNNCPKGPVDTGCICPLFYNPVCGCNNVTYDNACSAECDGIKNYTAGKCP